MIVVEKEPKAVTREFRGVKENCALCGCPSLTWHKETNTPVCTPCSKRYDLKDIWWPENRAPIVKTHKAAGRTWLYPEGKGAVRWGVSKECMTHYVHIQEAAPKGYSTYHIFAYLCKIVDCGTDEQEAVRVAREALKNKEWGTMAIFHHYRGAGGFAPGIGITERLNKKGKKKSHGVAGYAVHFPRYESENDGFINYHLVDQYGKLPEEWLDFVEHQGGQELYQQHTKT